MNIIETPNYFEIHFAFNWNILNAVKALPGRKFISDKKLWVVPVRYRNDVENFAQKYHFIMDNSPVNEPEQVGEIQPLPDLTIKIPLKMELYHYQERGVAYSLLKKRLIISDQMGLGKTAQAIATITAANAFPCLIICPATLKLNWEREWKMWTNKMAMSLHDGIRRTWPLFWEANMAQVFIVNYESLKKYFVEEINKEKDQPLRLNHVKFSKNIEIFKSVIIDEVHKCKDSKTQQSKFTKGIAYGKEFILALTGTPVVNKPQDLIPQLGIIDRIKEFGGYKHFMQRYCKNGSGASNLNELNYLLNKHCYYRREKSEVLTDLPAKTRQVVLCDITTMKEYQDAVKDLAAYLVEYKNATDDQVRKSMRGEVMVRIGICKNISARGKLDAVIEYLASIIDEGNKIGIFVHLMEIADALKKAFPKAVTILGEDNIQARQANIDSFQNNPDTKLIICSIKAAGVGITLTSGSIASFIELPWHAADTEQCEDRFHRVGQKDNVQCIYFLGKGTIDEWIYNLIIEKRDIAYQITGAKNNVEEKVIDGLINLFNNNKI